MKRIGREKAEALGWHPRLSRSDRKGAGLVKVKSTTLRLLTMQETWVEKIASAAVRHGKLSMLVLVYSKPHAALNRRWCTSRI